MTDFLTTTQAAEQVACNSSTIRYAIKNKHLKAMKYGKTWLITPANLQDWIDNEAAHKTGVKPKRERST